MKTSIVAVLSGASSALAAVRGFNYAAQGQTQASFAAAFRTAGGLAGAENFTSARLYTMIQEGTTDAPISAIEAAIETQTTLLLGLWASSPQATFDHEITALTKAIEQYGADFTDLVEGISVGSEDLYRTSVTGLINDPQGVGQTPGTLVEYMAQVRQAIAGTALRGVPVGHVDTFNAFANSSNSLVLSACDFVGIDAYPYFQSTDNNTIEHSQQLFFEAYDGIAAATEGAQLWVTEAGWPTAGPESGQAVASIDNAEIFWQDVACELIDRDIDFWWYILADVGASPSFGVSQDGKPLYNLACHATSGAGSSGNSTSNSTLQSSHFSGSSFSNVTSSTATTISDNTTDITHVTTATAAVACLNAGSGFSSGTDPALASQSSSGSSNSSEPSA